MVHNFFKEGVFQPPAGHEDDIKHMQDWLKGQLHLPTVSDQHLHLFLNSCDYQITKSKETLENYYTLRTSSPELFANRDPHLPEIQAFLNICHLMPLSWKTPEGYRIMLYRLSDFDSAKFDFINGVKMFCMFNDMRGAEDGLCSGYIGILDMKGLTLGHVGKLHLTTLKKILTYIQDCQPIALKGVHVINTPSFIDKIMLLAKPFIKSEFMSMLKFHPTHEGLSSFLPLKYLPEDYGGESEKAAVIHAREKARMENDYPKWFKEEETLKVDESKRTGKKHPYSEISQGAEGSFRKLAID